MKYALAAILCLLLIGGMFAFAYYMTNQMRLWQDAGLELSNFQIGLAKAAMQIHRYWYAFAVIIVVFCLGIAAIPMRRSDRRR